MVSKRDLTIFAAGIILVIIGFIYVNNDNSLFSSIVGLQSPVNWDEVRERDIMKTTFPITLLEENGSQCLVTAPRFDGIIHHEYFTHGDKLGNELQFDSESSTIIVPCDQLDGEKSRFEVWNVVPDASNHAKKYEYWITPWE